jgi:hypothetical protein
LAGGGLSGTHPRPWVPRQLHLRRRPPHSSSVTNRVEQMRTASGEFSSASAYRALFISRSLLLGASHLWKVQAPRRVRFFCWLVLHDRCWTYNRLQRHGLSDMVWVIGMIALSLCSRGGDVWPSPYPVRLQ